ncbi:hypothetical protein AB4383_16760 [Vibrio breoganii]
MLTILKSLAIALLLLGMVFFLCYDMWVSTAVAIAIIASLFIRSAFSKSISLIILSVVFWHSTLIEYSNKALEMHCRITSVFDSTGRLCKNQPKFDLKEGQDILTTREQMGTYVLNIAMAAGGYVAGYKEVAFETIQLAVTPKNAGFDSYTISQRKNQCIASKAHVEYTEISEALPEFFLSASYMKDKINNTKDTSSTTGITSKNINGTSNNGVYYDLMTKFNLRVPLALYVHGDTFNIERHTDNIEVTWSGNIVYPYQAYFNMPLKWFIVPLPLDTPEYVLLSEAIFCGMQMDGKMNPYKQVWTEILIQRINVY